ncbi:MAG: isocitrate lyase/PEP mutase family protein [Pyrinomonadaceae bacterium]
MNSNASVQLTAIERFRKLHESGCFVLPNPWDVGTAVYLERLGFQALATTSAGYAFTRALPDSVLAISRDEMLNHVRELAGATPLPVNADFQNGYADSPEDVAISVALCIETGVAGLSIEDNTGQDASPLYERRLAIERIKAARAAIDGAGVPVILTARCEAGLVGVEKPLEVALERLVAFADAGADCLYAPGLSEPDEIAAIVKAVSPKPVNVLMSKPSPSLPVSRLADLGVRRISVGSALARVAWGAFIRSAREIAERGSFDTFGEAASFKELDEVFAQRK